MDVAEIRTRIKQVIASTTSIDPEKIADTASFKDDLMLDSLTMLEIAIDVDHEFGLKLPEERLGEMVTVQDSVELVQQHLTGAGVEV
jgi:acyl carrier protein